MKQFDEAVQLYKSMSEGGTGTVLDNVWIRFEEYLKANDPNYNLSKDYYKVSANGSYLAYVPSYQSVDEGGVKVTNLDAETLKAMALKSSEMDEKELDIFMKIFKFTNIPNYTRIYDCIF